MGTPEFAADVAFGKPVFPVGEVAPLMVLHQATFSQPWLKLVAVYCQPPKPAGRGHRMQITPVQIAAEACGIEARTPKTLRDPIEQEKFAALNLDVAVVAAYGLILPEGILKAPKYGCINIHGSLLPRWRGAAPIQRAILAGDKETGITIMQMDSGVDTGAMLMKESVAITDKTTAQSLQRDLAGIGARLIVRALADLAAGKLKPTPQPEEGACYAAKLTREDGKIDWTKPASEIERQIRALTPWPGCFFSLKGENVKALAATIVADKTGAPGTLLDERFTVACGKQALRFDRVQRAGKNATDGASLLRGLRLPIGSQL